MIDIRQTLRYATYLTSIGWKVERIDGVNYFIKKFPLIGALLKIQRPEKIDFNTVDKLCRKYRIFQVIIEPKNSIQELKIKKVGYKLSKHPYLPTKTLQIDLTQRQTEVFDNLKKDARASVKRGETNKTKEYSTPSGIRKWQAAWKSSVKFNRYVPAVDHLVNLRKSFPNDHSLFLASHNMSGRIIGGALFTTSSHEKINDIAYYWYGFTSSEGRSTLSAYSLLWQGILWAKKTGCTVFDFEGIYDSRFPNKSWLGFTHFKCSFGGAEVLYPGCYTKFRLPV